jgi:ketoreductase RED2
VSTPIAIVTGSTSGIGRAIAERLASDGYGVVINSVTSVEAGEQLAASLPVAHYHQADVSHEAQAQGLVDTCIAEYGRLDVLINNAGQTSRIPHHDLDAVDAELFRHVLNVNVVGTWNVTRAAASHLKATGAGHVINVSSVAGLRPSGSSVPYATSKAALNHLTKLLAKVLGPEIRVNGLAPGLIDTPWTATWDDAKERVSRTAPMRRVGEPDDVATMCALLLQSTHVTGVIIPVDGGQLLT